MPTSQPSLSRALLAPKVEFVETAVLPLDLDPADELGRQHELHVADLRRPVEESHDQPATKHSQLPVFIVAALV
eukprot:6199123-Pleurochrysis_carterae.AAC.2